MKFADQGWQTTFTRQTFTNLKLLPSLKVTFMNNHLAFVNRSLLTLLACEGLKTDIKVSSVCRKTKTKVNALANHEMQTAQ